MPTLCVCGNEKENFDGRVSTGDRNTRGSENRVAKGADSMD